VLASLRVQTATVTGVVDFTRMGCTKNEHNKKERDLDKINARSGTKVKPEKCNAKESNEDATSKTELIE
jgi:hypothetical protein